MRLPIQKQDAKFICECPFYCKDTLGNFGCLVKEIGSAKTWGNSVSSDQNHEDFEDKYQEDCGGEFDNCCFAELIWGNDDNTDNSNQSEDQGEQETVAVKISVHKVDNPYMVKTDVLVYPTNNLLEIDDPLLNRMTRGVAQKECDLLKTNVRMGNVYTTSNGGNWAKGIQAKKIYHAVVAGESRLVNDIDIKKSIIKSLIMADTEKYKIVSMLPADCGTHDIESAAFSQISAIQEFIKTVGVEHIEYIFIVMDDQDSYDVFIDQFSRIFTD